MSGVRARLRADLREAMKAKDAPRRNTIRMLEAAIKNAEIEQRSKQGSKELAEPDILSILQKQVKQRKDSITQYQQGNRPDLAEIEQAEISIIEQYLPQQLTAEEIKARAQAIISQVGAKGPEDKGKVMAPLMKELRGKAEGSQINQTVTQLLTELAET